MLHLYFDHKNEYVLINDKLIAYPLGAAFIDFISLDFLKRDVKKTNAIEQNPLLKLCSSKGSMWILGDKFLDIIARYAIATEDVLNADNEDFKELDVVTRYNFHQTYINPSIAQGSVQITYLYRQVSGNIISKENMKDTKLNSKEFALQFKNSKFDLIEMYSVNTLEEALYISFMKMVSNNIKVKKCKSCNKYFIPEGRIDTEYCNRTAPNSSKKCSEIGAIKRYHEKSNSNPIKREFQKEYKKINARVRLGRITQQSFYTWSEKARLLRERAINENWDLGTFVDELKNMEV